MEKIKVKFNKKGQMTVWVIIAVVLVAAIIVYLLVSGNKPGVLASDKDFGSSIKSCAKEATLEAVDKMLPQGGFIEPGNYKMWQDMNVEYLCYTASNYQQCISQHPDFIGEEEKEIGSYVLPVVEDCFNSLKQERQKKGETVVYAPLKLTVDLAPGEILVSIDRKTTITKNEEQTEIGNYDVVLNSPVYDLANVAMRIASDQAKYCYFEYVGYMMLYPQFLITVDTMSDSTRIYTIKDKISEKEINVAIRSCTISPGGRV